MKNSEIIYEALNILSNRQIEKGNNQSQLERKMWELVMRFLLDSVYSERDREAEDVQ